MTGFVLDDGLEEIAADRLQAAADIVPGHKQNPSQE